MNKGVYWGFFTFLLWGCQEATLPKPYGFFRIDFPDKSYHEERVGSAPFIFSIPDYATLRSVLESNDSLWMEVDIKRLSARIYLTYRRIENNLDLLVEDVFEMNAKQLKKATSNQPSHISYPEHKVYGILLKLGGNTGTSTQFMVTDSVRHFMYGSLYFYCVPNSDSLAPLISFMREDVEHLIKTLQWE